jgi:hypothetical protein
MMLGRRWCNGRNGGSGAFQLMLCGFAHCCPPTRQNAGEQYEL